MKIKILDLVTIDQVAESVHNVEGIMLPYRALSEGLKAPLRLKAVAAVLALRRPPKNALEELGQIQINDECSIGSDVVEKIWKSVIDRIVVSSK